MNFIFMIILILIILLFFNIYLKQINSSFYTSIILFVLIINEIYFSKIEKFDANIAQQLIPTQPSYRLDYDFKQHMNKQMCLFDQQKNIITNNLPIISKCHKIFNRKSCDEYRECEYDTEFNRCNEKSNCNNIDTEPLKCRFMDNKDTCNNLAKKIPKCEIYKNTDICNGTYGCDWNNNKCEYKSKTCDALTDTECSTSDNCKWEYYNDIYNAEKNTNMQQCHSLDLLKYSGWINKEITGINETDINKKLNKYLVVNPDVKYYGIQKTVMGEYNLVFLKCNSLSTISPSKIQQDKCLNENKYLGNNDNVMIYKRQGQCKTKIKCKWNDNDPVIERKCNTNSDEQNCLDEPDCYYEYNSNKCLPKGVCEDKIVTTQTSQGNGDISNGQNTNGICYINRPT